MNSSHVLTIDLPVTLFRAASRMAAERGISLVRLAREAIEEKTNGRDEMDLSKAYESLAEDPAEADVEVFFPAQAEAVRE